MTGGRALFVDRDGTLIEDPGYLCDPTQIRLLDGVIDGLAQAIALGLTPVIVSNQSGVGRGMYSVDQLATVDAALRDILRRHGVVIGPSFYCIHTPDDRCSCRKPAPGLLLRAAREHEYDLSSSIMVGDRERDVEAGLAAGCSAVAVGFDSTHRDVRRIHRLTDLVGVLDATG